MGKLSKAEVFNKFKELENVSLKSKDGKRGIKSFVLRTNPLSKRLTKGILDYYNDYAFPYNSDDYNKINLSNLFVNPEKCLVVEIGFGNGESFVKMAENDNEANYFGLDVYFEGFAECLTSIGEKKLKNAKVMRADAKEVLTYKVIDESVDCFNIFFPDPWPKKKHHKRRLINTEFTGLLIKKLKHNGIIHFATDIEDYADEVLTIFSSYENLRNLFEKYSPTSYGREHTNFEQKGIDAGRTIRDIVFIKT